MPADHVPHTRHGSGAREPTPPSRVGKGVGGLGPDVRAQTAVEAPLPLPLPRCGGRGEISPRAVSFPPPP
jgi:hypothetical protein